MAFWKFEIRAKRPIPNVPQELKSIGDHIRKRRVELQLLQKEVATRLKVCEESVTLWETNRSKPMIHHMPSIISFLGYLPIEVDDSTLGGKIKRYRLLNGLSHKKLGRRLTVDASTIASWEKYMRCPDKTNLSRLKKLLNTSG